jgi:GntR family transcriptional repressor for pyruvate dehydrogenase complex
MAKKYLFSKPVKKLTMAEQMAETIKELILTGSLEPGDTLPTEPELCEQFGVSRAVVRDATRILMALGLVDVKHGAGVFVTESQSAAFGEALLIALRRAGASAWDVEEFEQIMLPEVIALAATAATDEEIAEMRQYVQDYRLVIKEFYQRRFEGQPILPSEEKAFIESSRRISKAIFKASHNHVFQQLAEPLLKLRNLRLWQDDPEDTPESLTEMETLFFNTLVDVIASRDPRLAREQAQRLMKLPPVAIETMKQTPVGEQPKIPISISQIIKELQENPS